MAADPTKAWLKQHRAGERLLAKVLRSYFKRQTASIANALGDLSTPSVVIVPLIFDQSAERQKMLAALAEPMLGLMATGAERVLATAPTRRTRPKAAAAAIAKAYDTSEFDFEPFTLPAYVIDAIRQGWVEIEAADYWAAIQAATAEKLTDVLSASIQAGLNGYDTMKAVRRALGEIGRTRANAIARTETTLAYNAGHEAAYQGLAADGVEFTKRWLAVRAGNTRQSHAEANGQAAGADGLFTVGGEKCRYPGDAGLPSAERINCRCSTVADGDG